MGKGGPVGENENKGTIQIGYLQQRVFPKETGKGLLFEAGRGFALLVNLTRAKRTTEEDRRKNISGGGKMAERTAIHL